VSEKKRILLGFPGPTIEFGAIKGILNASPAGHTVRTAASKTGWDDFNICWLGALNGFEAGEFTHFAMLHGDVFPEDGWIDVLLEEMERLSLGLITATVPIKDGRGLTSSGLIDPSTPWSPYRRFTVRETLALPETFTAADAGYPGYGLLHNNGCLLADLSRPEFYKLNAAGELAIYFRFPRRGIRGENGRWENQGESEDWHFSRMVHESGVPNALTRKVRLTHKEFPNYEPWGLYQNGDEDTAHRWRKEPEQCASDSRPTSDPMTSPTPPASPKPGRRGRPRKSVKASAPDLSAAA
jgi:hypothetical protein